MSGFSITLVLVYFHKSNERLICKDPLVVHSKKVERLDIKAEELLLSRWLVKPLGVYTFASGGESSGNLDLVT